MMRSHRRWHFCVLPVALLPLVIVLGGPSAAASAWTVPEGQMVVTGSLGFDFFDREQQISTNHLPLELDGGSVVKTGRVERYAFFVTGEYGLFDKLTLTLTVPYVYTRHASVGTTLRQMTNAEPNSDSGLQDLALGLRYQFLHLWESTPFGLAALVNVIAPLGTYNTSIHNTLGDGVLAVELGFAASHAFPDIGLAYNLDFVYRLRDDKAVRVGNIFPPAVQDADPDFPDVLIGGKVADQFYLTAELDYFVTQWLGARMFVKVMDTLGGETMSYNGMTRMQSMSGGHKISMFENAVGYEQDAVFVGGGTQIQIRDDFGVGITYTHALWFRNFPNTKMVGVAVTYSL